MIRKALAARTALLALLAAASAPAAVQAASVAVPSRCYVSLAATANYPSVAQPIPVEAEDITPGRQVRLTLEVKGTQTASSTMLTASKIGQLTTSLETWSTGMPAGPTKGTEARVVLRDFWLGTELGAATIDVANVGLYVEREVVTFGTNRRWLISGLSGLGGGKTYYAHYFSNASSSAKYLGKQRLGRTSDRCGFMRADRPLTIINKLGKHVAKIQASAKWNAKLPWTGGWISMLGPDEAPPASDSAPTSSDSDTSTDDSTDPVV